VAISVFLIPSVRAEDKGVLWQFEMLGQGYGFEVHRATRSRTIVLSKATQRAIGASDFVISIVTKALTSHARAELEAALELSVPTLVFVESGVRAALPREVETIRFSRGMDVKEVAELIAQHIDRVSRPRTRRPRNATKSSARQAPSVSRETKVALGLFAAVGLALLSLAALSSEEEPDDARR
jgi:hypothetical protein